jgi:hypothetical protein
MKIRTSLLLITLPALLGACAGTTRVVTDTALAGVGAIAGNKLGDGDPLITAAGAAGGVLVGEALNWTNDNHAKKAYAQGFDKGRSDAVKQQYWVMVNQQKAAEGQTFDEDISLFEIPVPEQRIDGVILKPTTKILRIEE